jgi:hypothetical protein
MAKEPQLHPEEFLTTYDPANLTNFSFGPEVSAAKKGAVLFIGFNSLLQECDTNQSHIPSFGNRNFLQPTLWI